MSSPYLVLTSFEVKHLVFMKSCSLSGCCFFFSHLLFFLKFVKQKKKSSRSLYSYTFKRKFHYFRSNFDRAEEHKNNYGKAITALKMGRIWVFHCGHCAASSKRSLMTKFQQQLPEVQYVKWVILFLFLPFIMKNVNKKMYIFHTEVLPSFLKIQTLR